jgi:outer membrane receptor for ferrienterochelin and colicins
MPKPNELLSCRRRCAWRRTGLLFAGLFSVFLVGKLLADDTLLTRPTSELADLSLKELMQIEVPTVVTASKYVQKANEAPSSVSVVTADDIKKYGYHTLADILRSVRDFYVTYDRNYGYIGTRGFDGHQDFGGRILILVDGHRLNEPLYGSAFAMTDFILDVDLIERVEIIRGPGSSLYGDNAFFAIVNVISRRGDDFRGHGVELSGDAGSFGTYKGRVSYGNTFRNGLDLVLSGSLFTSDGHEQLFYKEFDSPDSNNGIAKNLDGDSSSSVFARAAYKDLSLEGGYVSREKEVPTASYFTFFNDPHYHTIDTRAFTEVKYSHEFENELILLARAYYDFYEHDAVHPFNVAATGQPPDIVLNKDVAPAEWWGGEVQATKKLFEKHKLTLGAEYRDDFRLQQRNFDIDPFAVHLNSSRNTQSYALYAQDEFQVLTNLILNVGVRYDYFYTFGSTTNPRFGIIYNPFEQTTLKFLYGTAFRAPNGNELYYSSVYQETNPSLGPETIDTYELIWEQNLGPHFRATASGFYYKIKDLISETVDTNNNLLVFKNIGEVESKGASAELEAKWANGIRGHISYTYADTEDVQTGERLSNSPKHLGKLNLILPVYEDKLFAGVEFQYTSDRLTLSGNQLSDFYVVNLTLFNQKLVKGWQASASIYNLFDAKYSDPGGVEHVQDAIRQDGRTFRIKLTYRF